MDENIIGILIFCIVLGINFFALLAFVLLFVYFGNKKKISSYALSVGLTSAVMTIMYEVFLIFLGGHEARDLSSLNVVVGIFVMFITILLPFAVAALSIFFLARKNKSNFLQITISVALATPLLVMQIYIVIILTCLLTGGCP